MFNPRGWRAISKNLGRMKDTIFYCEDLVLGVSPGGNDLEAKVDSLKVFERIRDWGDNLGGNNSYCTSVKI